MERMQKAAIEVAIALEVRSLTLYRTLSSKVTDITIRRIFKLLAHTAAEHLESFCNLYQGSDHELIALLGGKAFMCGSVPAK
jgi:rubrerythrin